MADIKNTFGTNLISHWKLEETSGTRLDETASNNDLTDNNTVLSASGVVTGNGADFELANTEYLSISDASQTGLDCATTDKITVSAWVKFESIPAGTWQPVVVKDDGQPNRSYAIGFRDRGDGKYSAEMLVSRDGDNATSFQNYLDASSSGYLSTGVWYHAVWIFDGSTTNFTFYLNGTSKGSVSLNANATAIFNSGATFMIGKLGASAVYFDGVIDEVTIWDRALTSGEVTTLYNSGTPLEWETQMSIDSFSPRSRRPINTSKFTKKHLPTLLHRPTPAHLLAVDGGLTASTPSASWSIVSPSISGSGVVTASEQTATWSIPAYGVVIGDDLTVPVSTVSAAWSIEPLTGITNDMIFSVNTLSATWSTETRLLEGVFWTRKYNVSDSFWSNKY
jgi:hypothetical protein